MNKMKSVMMLVLALLLAVQGLGVTNAQAAGATIIDELTAESIFEDLGDALNYGTVAREWEQKDHAETSVCVDYFDRYNNTIFANTNTTYFHAAHYKLQVDISAPLNLHGMEFALYKESGNGYVRCAGTEKTVSTNGRFASLVWEIGEELKNTRLYAFQTNGDGYVENGTPNGVNMTVAYGPSLSSSAHNDNYIGKVVYHGQLGENDSMGIFNTSTYSPGLIFGPETRAYYKKWNQELQKDEYFLIDPNDKTLVVDGNQPNGSVLVNYYYTDKADFEPATDDASLQMAYMKLDGMTFKNGKFYKGDDEILVEYREKGGYADKLIDNAAKISRKWGNLGGGVITSTNVLKDGNSTVTGPVTDDGYVVSVYDAEFGSNNTFAVKEDMGFNGIPVANNEYVIVNLICPSKDGTVYMGGAGTISYYHEGGFEEQVAWGGEDSGCSQRVIYNFVYADDNGVMQPFEGTIVPNNGHGGTILAPNAYVNVSDNVHNGAMIADKVTNSKEIHQRNIAPLERYTWIRMNGGWLELQKASAGYDWGPDNRWEDMSANVSLAGAEFGVYSDPDCTKDSLVITMTTDAQGKAKSELLAAGDYWIKEITPLKDHELNTKVIKVTVKAGETVPVQGGGYVIKHDGYYGMYGWVPGYDEWVVSVDKFVNEQNEGAVNLRLLKHDEFGEPMQGVVFNIYDHDNKLVGTMKTNRNGVAEYEGLPLRFSYGMNGSKTPRPYYVKEISAPDGYWTDDTVVTLRLTKDKQNQTIVIDGNGNENGTAFVNNIKRGNLRINKVSAHNGQPLGGAEFTIYSDKDCKTVVATITTGKNGIATTENVVVNKQTGLKGLLPGTYYVKETKAPERYLLPDPAPVYTVKVVHSKITDVTAEPIGNHAVISIAGNKVWHDKGFDNNRPSEVQIEIYKGSEYVTGAKVSAANNWTFRFENLRRYDDDGNEITYTIKENLGGRGYEYYTYINKVDQNGNITATVANSIKKTKIDGVKIWEKGDNDAELPDTITFLLYQKVGEKDVPVLDGQGNQMKCTGRKHENYKFWFSDLPTYAADGEDAVYVVKEEPSDHYMQIDSKFTSETNGGITSLMFTLTNRQTVALEGTKVWQDSNNPNRPDHVTLKVSRNGVEMKKQPEVTWESKEGDVWSWKISGLDKYDENGNLNVYTVKETIPAGYTSSQTTNADGTITIYNTIPGNIQLYKRDDKNSTHLNGAQFKLYYDADCKKPVFDPETYFETKSVFWGNRWRHGWLIIENLVPGTYYIQESLAPDGYSLPNPNLPIPVTVVAGENDNRVNSHLPVGHPSHRVVLNTRDNQNTTVYVDKKWVGDENKLGARPSSITVQLYAGNAPISGKTLELNAGNGWSGSFTRLPEKENGQTINYSVKETSVVPNYHTQVSGSLATGFTITNTYNLTSITAEKKWVGVVPAEAPEVTFQLYAGKDPVPGKTAVLNSENKWKCTFENLPIKDLQTGEPIVYTVKETDVDGFTSSGDGTADNNYTITNTVIGGWLKLKKVDGDNNSPLGGAKFGIYTDKDCNTLLAEMITGNDGVATSDRLKAGTYYVKEIEAPKDYQIGQKDAVEVKVERDQTVTVKGDKDNGDFTNVKRAIVYINKVEAELNEWNQPDKNTVKPLKGAKFTIYSDANCTKVEAVMETDENGYAEAALIPGRQYWIKETEAPAGYEILVPSTHNFWANLGNPMKLTWGNWDQNVDGAMVNVKVKSAVGAITLTKADAAESSNKKLSGAVFGVYEDENLKYTMEATDENGKSTLINIPVGKYYVQEITAPAGYKLDTTKYEVEVTAGGVAAVNNGNVIPNTMKEGEASFSFVKKLEIKQANVTGEVYRFTFTLTPDGNTPDTYSVTATNADQYTVTPVKDADGKITHYEVTVTMPAVPENASDVQQKIGLDFKFKKIGTYTFTLQEKQPDSIDDGWYYDTAERVITFNVAEGTDKLDVTETYAENATQITITNTYTASGKLKLNVYKEMVNREFQEGDEFTFTVDAEAGVPMPEQTSVTIRPTSGDTAVVDFGEIDYTMLDVGQTYKYTYKLKENAGSLPGVTYDDQEYTVTVTVGDNGTGTLVANAVYPTDDKVVFTNTYTKPASIQLKLNVEKVMAGRDFKEGDEFTFTVVGSVGAPMPEKTSVMIKPTSDNMAVVDFGEITYTQADAGQKYTYTVQEIKGSIADVVYDTKSYTVDVTITANEDGTLTATPVYQTGEKITITNTHVTQYECKLTMAATKAITGTARRAVPAPAFDFAVYVGDELVEGREPDFMGWNTDNGTIVFEDIVYTLEDVGRKYLYQVLEVKGADKDGTFDYVSWDNTVFTVEVDVFLNEKGEVTYSEPIYREGTLMTGGINFTNEVNYRVGSVTLKKVDSANTSFGLAGAEFGVYTDLACTDLVGTILTDNKGEGGLEGLKFGTYYVKETKAPQGYVLSDKIYTVDVLTEETPAVVNAANGGYVTNDRISEVVDLWTSFTVRKVWQGENGGEISLVLFANGVMMNPQPTPIRNGDVYTYVNLPKYDANGMRITYTVKETSMVNYTTSYQNPAPYANETNFAYDGGVIINQEMTSFAVRKIWTGLKEGESVPAIKLLLYCNGELYSEAMPTPTADGWYIYNNLPSMVNGVKAVYSVKEEALSGWLTVYINTDDMADGDCAYNGGTIQNSKIPQTGDTGHQSLWMAMMALVMVGWVALRALERKWGFN